MRMIFVLLCVILASLRLKFTSLVICLHTQVDTTSLISIRETTQFVVTGLTLQDSLLLYITTTFYVN